VIKRKTKINHNNGKNAATRFKAGHYDNLFEDDGIFPYGIMIKNHNIVDLSRKILFIL
jgi:hypothetical protein